MKPFSLGLLLFLFWIPVHCQNTILPGYIVRDGDTLRGDLKIDRQRNLMHRVSFQRHGQKNFTDFTPSDLTSFCYDDGFLYQTVHFVNKSGPEPVAETLFGQTLVSGTYSLYSIDEDGDIYYVVKKDTATWFLYDDKPSLTGLEIIHGNYQNQLMFFSAGCEGLNFYKVPYSEKYLTDFMLQVNQCQSPGVATSSHYVKTHPEVTWFAYAGAMPFGSNWQTTLDGAVRLVNPRFDRKASLNIGLHYSGTGNLQSRHGTFWSSIFYPPNSEYDSAPITEHTLSIPVTLQYNMLSGRIQPAVYIGFSAAYSSLSPAAVGNEQKFALAIVAGVCIEAYVTSHLLIKADWRYEVLPQNPSIGLAYKF